MFSKFDYFKGPTTTEQLESQTESVEEVKQSQELQAQPPVVDSQEQPQVVEEEKIVSLAQELAAPVAESQPVVESEELKNSEEGIVEKLASLAQDLFSAPSEELQQTPVLIEETRSESEVRRTYLVGNDVVIEAVGCPLFQPDDILLRKDEILNKYKINDEQFELCRDFFNEKRDGTNLNNSILRVLMREALKVRSQVKANEQDVDRALEAVDENKDDKITFDEFVQLLLLFFSSKNNVENRVSNILKAKLNSETLSANDAVEFANFLNKFYGRQDNSEEFKDGLDVTDFLKDILPSLGTLAYVQPEPEVTEEKVENVEVAGEEVAKEEN
ncbi:unnamed protein product [Brachionus calyciflorus]|uniref:EF-hand domain-containing protein n=1 Tax=Brachionus calyciflorus TaxID=104777 RepID=A0A814Q2R9_9BILA|nr:unnamed protein product [Brachionus calyciflorus]